MKMSRHSRIAQEERRGLRPGVWAFVFLAAAFMFGLTKLQSSKSQQQAEDQAVDDRIVERAEMPESTTDADEPVALQQSNQNANAAYADFTGQPQATFVPRSQPLTITNQ